MTPERDLQRVEEDRITHVLEQAPAVTVPTDFAVRLMQRLPEPKLVRVRARRGLFVRRTHYGRNAMLAGAVLLCCLLLAAAMGHVSGTARQLMEWTALTQLGGIALWCGLAWRTT
jgi:hypothetical protein